MPFSCLSSQNDVDSMEDTSIRQSQTEGAKIQRLRLDQLRHAIRVNRVSFPAQVPVFEKHDRPDLQRKIVQLYFLLGWKCNSIAARYGVARQRVQQILNTWKRRAIEMGYVQHIPPVQELAGALAVSHAMRRPVDTVAPIPILLPQLTAEKTSEVPSRL